MKSKPEIKTEYALMVENASPKPKLLKNCLMAFVSGGFLCAAAEALKVWLLLAANLSEKDAAGATLVIIIGLTALITGLGFYDELGQKFGAGLAVPITGFANSVTAAAMDSKSEGWVLGTASNSFKLAGAVIVMGTFSAFIMALLLWLFQILS